MTDITALRTKAEELHAQFLATVDSVVPGAGKYDWFRAQPDSIAAGNRQNDDTSNDAALAGSVAIREAWDAYIKALHTFYGARDGEHGFLGSRERAARLALRTNPHRNQDN